MNNVSKMLIIVIVSLGFTSPVQASVKVYVPLGSANEIVIIDGDLDKVVGRIGDVINAHGLAATPDGNYLVAGSMSLAPKDKTIPEGMTADEHDAHHRNSNGEDRSPSYKASFVSLFNTETKRVVQRIEVDGITHHIAVTPDGRYAISTHSVSGNISIIDLIDGKLVKTISTGPVPNYALISRDGKYIYVSNSGNNTISEIETGQWILRRNITVGTTPEHMVFSSDEQTIYVVNVGDNTVAGVSLADGKITKIYPVSEEPHGIALSDDRDTLFVSSKSGYRLAAINIATGNSRNIVLEPKPYHITSLKGTGKLYVSSRAKPWIWVLDQDSLEVIRKIPFNGAGHQMVLVQ